MGFVYVYVYIVRICINEAHLGHAPHLLDRDLHLQLHAVLRLPVGSVGFGVDVWSVNTTNCLGLGWGFGWMYII